MADSCVECQPEREVRFAVVMYGGVSLAIYINGVAQELLNMVRATAPNAVDDPKSSDAGKALLNADDEELAGSAGVYRKLGQFLYGDREQLKWEEKPADPNLPNGKKIKTPRPQQQKPPIRTRFVVDVLSGTSAGGINGIFLAKALARNQKMRGLKDLWLQEGDLSRLLNDSFSVSDLDGFSVQDPQRSLLNSQRMYRKLLEALEQMAENKPDREVASPLVGELDLFITTTDIEGLPLPITLSDQLVYERRYKNVFHFRYATKQATGSQRDDFTKKDDPFLAFAARCTSSFPFAFEPMCLGDIEAVLKRYSRYASDDPKEAPPSKADDAGRWDRFFSDYLRLGLYDLDCRARKGEAQGLPKDPRSKQSDVAYATQRLREAFRGRSFGDGGYLDNKPFSYATSMLMRRHADVLVDRKLVYVEPAPSHPELAPKDRSERPDFADNILAAVLELPRDETIREDLDRLEERNRMIERITIFSRDMDRDLNLHGRKKPWGDTEFKAAGLFDMLGLYGIGYGAYHRLRVEETTLLLTNLLARIAGYDPSSDAAHAIQWLIEGWRKKHYLQERAGKQTGPGKFTPQTENEFLWKFDIQYRLRRLSFLGRRVNDLGSVDEHEALDSNAIELLRSSIDCKKTASELHLDKLGKEWVAAFRHALNCTKRDVLGRALKETRVTAEKLIHSEAHFEQERLTPSEMAGRPQIEKILYFATQSSENVDADSLSVADRELYEEWHSERVLIPKKLDQLSDDDKNRYFARRLRTLVGNLHLPWEKLAGLLESDDSERPQAIENLLGAQQRLDTLRLLDETISAAFRFGTFSDLRSLLQKPSGLSNAAELAAWCLTHYYDNFTYYDLVTYPLQYGTGVGEANTVKVFRISPEDATSLIDERRTGENRRKLAGTALMSFGAFIDRAWRKNDMLWGRLDGAERLITILLPPTPKKPDPNEEMRNDLIKEAHIAILGEEIREGDIQTLRLLLSNTLARTEPASAQSRKLREIVNAALDKKTLPAVMESVLRQSLDNPEDIWSYYKKQYEVNRDFEPENALRLISRATNVTGRMLEALASSYESDTGKRAAGWIARFGSIFWKMVAVAVPGSLGNLFARHWLGLLYLLSLVTIVLGIFMPDPMQSVGWMALGMTVGLNLILSLLGNYISGRRGWLRFLGGLFIVVLVALFGLGIMFVHEHWLPFVNKNAVALGWLAATGILLRFIFTECKNGFTRFLAQPHASFNARRLWWLTFVMAGLGILLSYLGPDRVLDLEFAGKVDSARAFVANSGVTKIQIHLWFDYLFIIAYSVTFAAYCVAAAKLLWLGLTTLQKSLAGKWKAAEAKGKDSKRRTKKDEEEEVVAAARLARRLSLLRSLRRRVVLVGFVLAGLQIVAGLADIGENTGLLWFLHDYNESQLPAGSTAHAGLTIALCCATLKFALIGMGGFYSIIGFFVGFFQEPSSVADRFSRFVFLTVSLIAVLAAWKALAAHPVLFQTICSYFTP